MLFPSGLCAVPEGCVQRLLGGLTDWGALDVAYLGVCTEYVRRFATEMGGGGGYAPAVGHAGSLGTYSKYVAMWQGGWGIRKRRPLRFGVDSGGVYTCRMQDAETQKRGMAAW